MIHKLALVIGGFGAGLVLVVAANTSAVNPPPTTAPIVAQRVADVAAAGGDQATPGPQADEQSLTDTVYVLPAPEPEVVHVTRERKGGTSATPRTTDKPKSSSDGSSSDDRYGDDGQERESSQTPEPHGTPEPRDD